MFNRLFLLGFIYEKLQIDTVCILMLIQPSIGSSRFKMIWLTCNVDSHAYILYRGTLFILSSFAHCHNLGQTACVILLDSWKLRLLTPNYLCVLHIYDVRDKGTRQSPLLLRSRFPISSLSSFDVYLCGKQREELKCQLS